MSNLTTNYYEETHHYFSIDKLKICFKTNPEDMVNYPLETIYTDNLTIEFLEYNEEVIRYNVKALDEFNVYSSIGILTISRGNKYENLSFFQFTNFSLYHIYGYIEDTPINGIYFIREIQDIFNLQFNSITNLEVALDNKINSISKIRKYIHNFKDYDLVLNGKKIKDENEVLSYYGEYFSRTRKQITKRPTLYFEQKDKSFGFRIYDKSSEIQSTNKDYISQDYNIFRSELYIKNQDIKDFCFSLSNTDYNLFSFYDSILDFILDDRFLFLLFFKYAKRTIYFIDKQTNIRIYLTDICKITSKFQDIVRLVA